QYFAFRRISAAWNELEHQLSVDIAHVAGLKGGDALRARRYDETRHDGEARMASDELEAEMRAGRKGELDDSTRIRHRPIRHRPLEEVSSIVRGVDDASVDRR